MGVEARRLALAARPPSVGGDDLGESVPPTGRQLGGQCPSRRREATSLSWLERWSPPLLSLTTAAPTTSPAPRPPGRRRRPAPPTRVARARTEDSRPHRRRSHDQGMGSRWLACSATIDGQSVPDATKGLYGLAVEGQIDLAAQVTNVDLDDVVVAVEVEIPVRGRGSRTWMPPARPAAGETRRSENSRGLRADTSLPRRQVWAAGSSTRSPDFQHARPDPGPSS